MNVNLDNPSVINILDAAVECFGKGGYHGTSLKEVAEVAGVSKALIHYHFSSKEALVLEMEARIYRQVAGEVTRMALSEKPGIETAMKALDELARQMQRLIPLTPVFVELSAAAIHRPELQIQTRSFMQEAERLVRAGIHQTLGAEVERLAIAPRRLAALILSCLHGIGLSALYGEREAPAARLEDLKWLLRRSLTHREGEEDVEESEAQSKRSDGGQR